jgi:hypothetical protein
VSEKSLNLVTATAENTDSHDSDHARTYATWSSVIFRPNVGSGRHGVALQLLNRAAWGSDFNEAVIALRLVLQFEQVPCLPM